MRRRVYEGLREEPMSLSTMPLPEPVKVVPLASPLQASEKLDQLVHRSLDVLGETLDIEPDRFTEETTQVAAHRVRVSAAEKILLTQTRVDDNTLKARQTNTLQDVLQRLQKTTRELPSVPVLDLAAE